MSKNSEYPTLSDYDLRILKERTRDISASPYRLFLAFVLSSISDALEPDDIEEVRRVLVEELGRSRCGRMSVDELSAFLSKESRGVEFSVERKKAKKGAATEVHRSSDDVRLGFDAEIAWVMSHYKMNIDTRVVSASVYANLVKNAVDEVKRRQKVK